MTDAMWNLLLVGLPESGKSTYLGALFHQLKDRSQDGLSLAEMPEDRDYLIELESDWLSLRPVRRSQHHGPKEIRIPLQEEEAQRSLELVVPDIIGEEYENAWEHGGWSSEIEVRISEADGILLFVRADDVHEAHLIDVTEKPRQEELSANTEPAPWEPSASPTQAKLCDLLEQVTEMRDGWLPPLTVIVSAWDAVASDGLAPEAWLDWKTPLLSQWLQAQSPDLTYRVFGISAQGGDIREEVVRTELAKNADSRPLPEGADSLTGPIRWLLSKTSTSVS